MEGYPSDSDWQDLLPEASVLRKVSSPEPYRRKYRGYWLPCGYIYSKLITQFLGYVAYREDGNRIVRQYIH